jgi:hypothetical protein
MAGFDSNDAYARFAASVMRKHRYVRDPDSERFLAELLSQAQLKVETLVAGTLLWRAQRGYEWRVEHDGDESYRVPAGHSPVRMKPRSDRATEGRVNPKGIPCLYLSTHKDTAMAEVRPWIGSKLSLAQFKAVRDLRVVNCTLHEDYKWYWGYETPADHWDDNAWCDIDAAFSRPVTGADDLAEYVPTQVIAEAFKAGGFDGVAYESSLGVGHNIALFDLDAVEVVACAPYKLSQMDFRFEQEYNPYVVKDAADASASVQQRHQPDRQTVDGPQSASASTHAHAGPTHAAGRTHGDSP